MGLGLKYLEIDIRVKNSIWKTPYAYAFYILIISYNNIFIL